MFPGEEEFREAIETLYAAIAAVGDPEAVSVMSSCLDKLTTVQAKLAQNGGGSSPTGPPPQPAMMPPPEMAGADPRAALMAQLGGGGF